VGRGLCNTLEAKRVCFNVVTELHPRTLDVGDRPRRPSV
jgi:hypothetical protein